MLPYKNQKGAKDSENWKTQLNLLTKTKVIIF